MSKLIEITGGTFLKKYLAPILFSVAVLTALLLGVALVIGVNQSAKAEVVADVSDQSREQAQATLKAQGIKTETFYIYSTEQEGTVSRQEPKAGTPLQKGQTVRLYVVLKKGKSTSKVETAAPVTQTDEQPTTQTNTNVQQKQPAQQNSQQTAAQRKAEIARQIAEANAAAAAAKQAAADELARLAAEQARVDGLYNAMVAADNEVIAARAAYRQAEWSVNDFAARGMLQSGAGSLAIQARNDAQARVDAAAAAAQAATAAWQAR